MGKSERIACIATPFVATLASLASLIIVFLAGTVKNNATLGDLYFLKMNMSQINLTQAAGVFSAASGQNLSNFTNALTAAKEQLHLKDFYTIYITNYCSWDEGQDPFSNCTAVERPFAFDPLEAWGINKAAANLNQTVDNILPEDLQKGIDVYKKLSHTMFYVYAVAVVTLVATLLVGISAMFSRWGSFITTFFSFAAALFTIVASAIASAMFVALKGVLTAVMDQGFSTKTDLGQRIFILTWIGAGFAFFSFQFWAWSICCCSGRSPYNPGSRESRRTRAEKTPYTYERVGSPLLGPKVASQQSMPLNPINIFAGNSYGNGPPPAAAATPGQRSTAYEPFRNTQV